MKPRARIFAVIAGITLLAAASCPAAVSYYVHPAIGDDANAGTDPQAPLRTLKRAGSLRLQAGDHLLLAAGRTFDGMLGFEGLAGTDSSPIRISSYQPAGAPAGLTASINARGWPAGVMLKNCAHVEIANLFITGNGGGMNLPQKKKAAMRCGVLIETDAAGEYSGFSLSNLVVKGIFYEEPGFSRSADEVRTANGTKAYGWGIRFINHSSAAVMKAITIRNCSIEGVSHTGLKFTAENNHGIRDVSVQQVRVADTGGPGVQMSGLRHGRFTGLDVNRCGSTRDSRNWGRGSGLWTWGSEDVVIEQSRFQNANGPGDSAGVHIDFNCRNVIVQHNFSANNTGGFCEILGNNYNCAYRYNVSVNDGRRVKGRGGAFQEGKTFWLSGYVGKGPPQGPFNSYFYNNTIYVSSNVVAKMAVAPTAVGVLIANNIFCLEGRSQMVIGDQSRPDDGKATGLKNVVFENNLFLRPDNWPDKLPLRDRSPIWGDPGFRNPGGLSLQDYMPRDAKLIQNRGVRIAKIPQDEIGLTVGLELERDILGNKILGTPDLGAIEIPGAGSATSSP